MQIFLKKMSKSQFELKVIDIVRQKRRLHNLSQAKLAKVLNVTAGYIGQIEMQDSPSMYSFNQLNELAKFFKCSPRDLFPENSM